MVMVFKTAQTSTAIGLSTLHRDKALAGANGGVKFMFDTAFSYCVPASAPTNGAVVRDISEHADGTFNGALPAYAGGGYDFSGITADPSEVVGGAGCLASIYAGSQYFMAVGWFKMPTISDFNTNATLAPIFCTTSGNSGYPSEADLLLIGQINSPLLSFRRQTNGGSTTDKIDLSPALHYGLVSQVAFWRNAAGQGARIKSAGGTTVGTLAIGSANTGDFSAKLPRWGVPDSFNNLAGIPAHQAASNMRLYRGWIEDLQVSGRNPLTVLDADFAATIARGVFS